MVVLHARLLDDVLAVGVEPQVPETDRRHEAVGLVDLAVGAEQSLDELDAGVFAKGALLLRLGGGGTEHGGLAGLEELLELVHDALAGLDELLDHLAVVLGPDLGHGLLGALDLARQLDEEQPELAGHLADGRARAVVVDGPVVDPLAERVRVEDAAEQLDGLLGRVPVLEREAGRDLVPLGIGLGGLAGRRRRGRLLVAHGARAGGLGSLGHRGGVAAHGTAGGRGRRPAVGLVARRGKPSISLPVEEVRGTALCVVAVISSMPTSVDSEVVLVGSRPGPAGQHEGVAAEIDELVLVGFPVGDRGRMVGKRRATLARGARRTRETWLARPRNTHIHSGVLAVARVPRREGRSTRAGEAAIVVDTTGAPVAEVSARRGPLRRRGVVVGRAPRRRRRGWAGELFLVEEVVLGGRAPVGRVGGHVLWLLRCPPRHPNSLVSQSAFLLSLSLSLVETPRPLRGVDVLRSVAALKIGMSIARVVVTRGKVTPVTLVCGR